MSICKKLLVFPAGCINLNEVNQRSVQQHSLLISFAHRYEEVLIFLGFAVPRCFRFVVGFFSWWRSSCSNSIRINKRSQSKRNEKVRGNSKHLNLGLKRFFLFTQAVVYVHDTTDAWIVVFWLVVYRGWTVRDIFRFLPAQINLTCFWTRHSLSPVGTDVISMTQTHAKLLYRICI